ncbi:DUF4232 domain-containing protein [Streptomyces sp. NPDC057424]|uniref:DUF4232 domain-containing protein n=1 Tax=Streptomyces sp. NPDC057424 TaxID=3346127 RepID=UPI0036B19473
MSVLLAAVACREGAAGRSAPTASAASSATSASKPAAAPARRDGTTPSASSTTPPSRCTGGRLSLSLGRVSPGAGNRYVPLVFTNTGTESCSLNGYPGVTLLDSAGDRIGEPAQRQGPDAPTVTLEPGGSAYAALHTVVEGVTDKPCSPRAAQVQAYPPGSTWALRTPANSFRVCGDIFEVSAVKPGRHP